MSPRQGNTDWIKALAFQVGFIILIFAMMIANAWSFYAAMALWGSFGMLGPLWFFVWLRRNLNEAVQEIGPLAQVYSKPRSIAALVVVTFVGATILSVPVGSQVWAFLYITFVPAAYCGLLLSQLYSAGNKDSGSVGVSHGS